MFTQDEKERVFAAYRDARLMGKDATSSCLAASRRLRHLRPCLQRGMISGEAMKLVTQHPEFLKFAQLRS
jgi:hypothetical protein